MTDLREPEAAFRERVRSNGKPDDARPLPAPNEPMKVARVLARERYQDDDSTPTLRHWRGGWWEWRTSHWVEVEQRAVRAAAYEFTEAARSTQTPKGTEVVPWAPNRHKIADLLEALAAICHLAETSPSRHGSTTRSRRGDRRLRQRAARRRRAATARPHTAVLQPDRGPVRLRPRAARRRAGSRSSTSSGVTTPTRSPRCRSGSATSISGPARPPQDPAARRADPRRQGRDRARRSAR